MTRQKEWHVWGPRGEFWFEARDGEEACDKYRARFALGFHALDEMSVDDVRDAS